MNPSPGSGRPVRVLADRQLLAALADIAVLGSVAVVGLLLALQGWRSTAPAIDMVSYFKGADDLLRAGILPTHGDVSSYGSFSPPGAAWLMAPGMLVFDDPRLFEKLGSSALHLVTLVGIFLVAREAFGRAAAYLAVAVYGVSSLGIAFAGSLWPIGHPAFAVWVVLLLIRWVSRSEATYLAAALLVFAVGMYDTMRIAPLGLIPPILWLLYRPPVSARRLVVVAAVALVVWFPYLRLESDRGFADLRSQLTLQSIVPADVRSTWCDPSLVVRTLPTASSASPSSTTPTEPGDGIGAVVPAEPSLAERLASRASMTLVGILAPFSESASWRPLAALLALMAMAAMARVAHETAPVQAVLRRLLPARSVWLRAPADAEASRQRTRHALLVATLVPWLILLVVAEPGRTVRFLFLWPLLAIWLAAFFTEVLGPALRDRSPRIAVPAATLVVAALLINPLVAHLPSWVSDGWAGTDAPEVVVADALADRIRADGRTSAAIGYRPFIYEFYANYNVIDPDYRVGTEFDLLFQFRNGITNTNTCPEGVSAADEYRIIQTEPLPVPEAPRAYFDVPVTEGFHTIAAFYRYQILQRD